MANVKAKSGARGSVKAAKAIESVLTTAFMTDTGGTLPKGAVGFTLRAPAKTVAMLADEPTKVKPLLKGYSDDARITAVDDPDQQGEDLSSALDKARAATFRSRKSSPARRC
ncbi:hypothetical protein HAP48_0000500 (plasmid) [Bradyrhizobium septentrionale]|uniref:Uncharacterized protein n=1 Tax=Bradyrhizobium septentrionale TaxID=1404411 RepID=A0A973WB50_9BRAD|nr:hypothetical protein [Bradyrhizobium septentrionale]UGY11959.1 hypothetical protein HAP48_0000500 [Bradyrhizobium septentrionale]UGY30160.1 hypothetical protein HU675_0047885 [Bradyrhizobium septentrionale]